MPKLTIDGVEVEVPKGTKIIEAAKKANKDIPFYCYHPGLSVAGNCRMCLVEIEKMPKLQISCHMEAQDDMVVHTKSERVLQTRKHVLEFLLVNHPVDCPVCDQAGECWLQDYYLRHGSYDSRLQEDKVKKPKAVPVGPNVMLDSERCILCSRCVRFTDEISKTEELGIVERGDHSKIEVFPGKDLNNPYSGNVVDICPVGALTDRDFRFKMRVWYLKSKPSLCNGCSRGCNIEMQYREGRMHHAKGERVMRLKPRYNPDVNEWWMCDEGRYGYKFHDQNRITDPHTRQGTEIQDTSWESILPEIAKNLEQSTAKTGVFLSPQLSNEEIYLALKLFKKNLNMENVFLYSPVVDGAEDDILMKADKNPNTKGAELFGLQYDEEKVKQFLEKCEQGEMEGAVIFGQDLMTRLEAENALKKLKWCVFIGSNHNLTAESVSHVLPAATYAEKYGTFTNFEGRTQKFNRVLMPLGESKPEWEIIIELAESLGVHFRYDEAEEIFDELALHVEGFKGLSYENLEGQKSNVRNFAAPMIPTYMQQSDLVFDQYDATSQPNPVKEGEKV